MADLALVAYLVVVLPTYQLWRTLRTPSATARPRIARYFVSIGLALAPTAALVAIWIISRRSWSALGLGLPLAGIAGLGIALVGLVLMGALMRRQMKGAAPPKDALELLPVTPRERMAFLAMSVVIGFAWELLYRGYLYWVLAPRMGTILAVVLAATAYGAAHGYKGPKQFAGSLASAFVFTVAYVLTHSLWWLMAIHVALPLLAVWIGQQADWAANNNSELSPSEEAV